MLFCAAGPLLILAVGAMHYINKLASECDCSCMRSGALFGSQDDDVEDEVA